MKRRTVRFDIAVGGHDQVIRTYIVGEVGNSEVVDALLPGK
jgi:hypothetical protein